MARKFRLTYSRMAYFDIDVTAESAAEAEWLLEAALASETGLQDGCSPVGKPVHRIVEISVLEEDAAERPQVEAAA
jgi:hypothetical protein